MTTISNNDETVKTRILILSDTHCAPLATWNEPPFQAPLPSADLLIHCGDLTLSGQIDEYHKALDLLRAIDAPVKLVIGGNHDMSLDSDFVLSQIGKSRTRRGWNRIDTRELADFKIKQSRDLWLGKNGRARKEGVTYLEEGLHRIDLPNGARVNVYATPYTPEYRGTGFAYRKDHDRFNTAEQTLAGMHSIAESPVPSFSGCDQPVDILMSHGPPYGMMDETHRGEIAGCPHLLRAITRARPLITCFGHIHEGWGAERIRWFSDIDRVVSTPCSVEDWTQRGWPAAAATQTKVELDMENVTKAHCAYLDLSSAGSSELRRGKETMFINAAIMNARFKPVNAPWLIELDLPRKPDDNLL